MSTMYRDFSGGVGAGLGRILLGFGRSYAAFSSPVTVDVLLRFSLTLMNSGAWSSRFSCSLSSCKKEFIVHMKGQKDISYVKTEGFIVAGSSHYCPKPNECVVHVSWLSFYKPSHQTYAHP